MFNDQLTRELNKKFGYPEGYRGKIEMVEENLRKEEKTEED
jgi:hypothetical protein